MTQVPLREAQACLEDLLARVEEGETILITRSRRPPVRLGPVQSQDEEEDTLPSLHQWREDLQVKGESLIERAKERLRALRPPVLSWLTDVELHSALAKKGAEE